MRVKDFVFPNDVYKLRPYTEICKIVKKDYGLIPITDPPQKTISTVQRMIDRCFPVDAVSRYFEQNANALDVVGIVMYDSTVQKDDDARISYGICYTSDNRAIIALSSDLLHKKSEQFRDTVFLHELAHASCMKMDHDDEFAVAFCWRLENYFCWDETWSDVEKRADSKGYKFPKRKIMKY